MAVELPEAGRVIGDVMIKWLSEVDQQGEIAENREAWAAYLGIVKACAPTIR